MKFKNKIKSRNSSWLNPKQTYEGEGKNKILKFN